MGFDNRAADRQSHSETVGLGCKKGIENTRHILEINSLPRILNLNQHTFGVLL